MFALNVCNQGKTSCSPCTLIIPDILSADLTSAFPLTHTLKLWHADSYDPSIICKSMKLTLKPYANKVMLTSLKPYQQSPCS